MDTVFPLPTPANLSGMVSALLAAATGAFCFGVGVAGLFIEIGKDLVELGAGTLIAGEGMGLLGTDRTGTGTGSGLLGIGEMRFDETGTGAVRIGGSLARDETFKENKNGSGLKIH